MSDPRPAALRWQVVFGIVAVALVLRAPVVAVSSITGELGGAVGLSHAQLGLLTTLPVICFGLLAPPASWFVGRLGPDLATTVAAVGIGVGILLRSLGGVAPLFAGTIVAGAFLTVGNVVLPVVVHRDVPARHAPLVTGAYTAAFNVGATLAVLATAPLSDALGWRAGLAATVLLAVVALLAWLVRVRGERRSAARSSDPQAAARARAAPSGSGQRDAEPSGDAPARASVRRPLLAAAALAIAFLGQAFAYYGVTAWLPTILRDQSGFSPVAAGVGASVFQLTAIAGAFLVPLGARLFGLLRTTAVVAVLWFVFPLGLLAAPGAWLVWVIVGGVAQSAGITVIFILVVDLARNGGHARRLSALVQGIGYVAGASAPTLLGLAHDGTGSWTLPLWLVLAALVVYAAMALGVAAHSAARTHPGSSGTAGTAA